MRRSIRNKKIAPISPESSDSETPEKVGTSKKCTVETQDSSSESDIENYLQPINKINLNSEFFQIEKSPEIKSFESIEKDIFAGTNRLSDSESDDEQDEQPKDKSAPTSKLNFDQLHSYTKKLEEAKQVISTYEAKKKTKEKIVPSNDDISNLLALGETQVDVPDNSHSMHSSDFLSCSEEEDWEEVQEKIPKPSTSHSKEDIQITVALPDNMKKKKGLDLVASLKRRLNRIKKEHQVLVHKVHLLCWIAHGNYINKILNSEGVLALSLSLIPSQHSYPPERTDLGYLEQILGWYHKVMDLVEKSISKQWSLEKVLKLQLTRKQAYNKKMFVYIFICILRSLGIQCRLVLSFQVLPLRPPGTELHSLSTKIEKENGKSNTKKSTLNVDETKSDIVEKPELKNTKSPAVKSDKKNVKKSVDPVQIKNVTGSENKKNTTKENIEEGTNKARKSIQNGEATKKIKIAAKQQTESNKTEHKRKEATNKTRKSVQNVEVTKTIEVAEKQTESNTTEQNKKQTTNKTRKSTQNTEAMKKIKLSEKQQTESNTKKATNKTRKSIQNAEATKEIEVPEKQTESNNTEPKRKLKTISKSSNQSKSPKNTERISKPVQTRSKKSLIQLDGPNDSTDDDEFEKPKPNLKKLSEEKKRNCTKKHTKRLKKTPNYKDEDSSSDEESTAKKERLVNLQALKNKISGRSPLTLPSKPSDVKNDIISIIKTRIKQEKQASRSKLVKKRKSKSQSNEDSDYAPEPIAKKYDSDDDFYKDKVKVKKRIEVKKENTDLEKTKKGMDVWIEVFLEAEEKWISVDVVKNQIHCVNQLYSRASHPVSYIVAWNNNNSIKDITQRYCTNWNTTTRKLRIDSNWWTKTLKPYIGTKTARDKEEDEELAQLQLDKPLPSTISEYKDHPLYVLKRHLLKFQALYPPDLPPLGFVRNEPVYARDCVHVLHSREIWMKEAKMVKPNQQPYKIVKARPKYDRLSGKMITDLPLEVFGIWQVEDYIPPTAENGVVPKNAYGNVELFKPCMLPKGTVHLQLPGLNKVARKMNIDCVPAVVGFDFHSGWNHPTYDGFVVCEEYSEVLVAAWFQEQEEQEKREKEKIEKRVYGNWRKLIKGLLIRERLKQRYDYGESSQADAKGKKRKQKGPKFVSKKRRLCSDSESS